MKRGARCFENHLIRCEKWLMRSLESAHRWGLYLAWWEVMSTISAVRHHFEGAVVGRLVRSIESSTLLNVKVKLRVLAGDRQ